MNNESGRANSQEPETDQLTSGATETLRGAGNNQEPGEVGSGMSVGAGMGGFISYDPAGPVSTSLDETADGEGAGGGDGMTADQGSTGGRSIGRR